MGPSDDGSQVSSQLPVFFWKKKAPEAMDSWNTIQFSFWGPAYFPAQTAVSFRESGNLPRVHNVETKQSTHYTS